jgi:hypothetical protein
MNAAELASATNYITEKLSSLDNDFQRAFINLPNLQSSPFPITMYSLSIIDNFSALESGWSEQDRRLRRFQTERMVQFCTDRLHYPLMESKILVAIYRHSLMHTSQPQLIRDQNGMRYGWSLANSDSNNMKIISYPSNNATNVQLLHIGLGQIINDLRTAMLGDKGYMQQLRKNTLLQQNYVTCMNEISSKSISI